MEEEKRGDNENYPLPSGERDRVRGREIRTTRYEKNRRW